MRDCSKILTVGIQGICLVALIMFAGCGDGEKRAAAREVREATNTARRLYNKAHATLSNPRSYKTIDAKTIAATDAKAEQAAMSDLARAEKELSSAISANASMQQDISGDMAEAKLLLGLIRQLQGQTILWDSQDIVLEARQAGEVAYLKLSAAQSSNTSVLGYKNKLESSSKDIEEARSKAQEAKQAAQASITKCNKQLKALESQIVALNKSIEDNNLKASTFKKNSAMASGTKSLDELEKAHAAEKQIQDDHFKLQAIDHKKIKLNSKLELAKIKLQDATGRLEKLEQVDEASSTSAKAYEAKLADSKLKLDELWSQAFEAQEKAAGLCKKVVDMTAKSEKALDKATKDIADAQNLAQAKAQMLLSQVNVLVAKAENHLTVMEIGKTASGLADYARTVAKDMVDEPAQSVAPALEQCLDAAKSAQEKALKSYKQAVDVANKALRAARGDKWQYQATLAVTYFKYALALKDAGKKADAQQILQKAKDMLSKAERSAKTSSKKRALLELKSFLKAGINK